VNLSLLLDLTWLSIAVRELSWLCIDNSTDGADLGLGNLPSLQMFYADLQSEGVYKEEAEQAKAALTHGAEMHPNHPYHYINLYDRGAPTLMAFHPLCVSLTLVALFSHSSTLFSGFIFF
jgi:hypothetical protein